jgi:DNA invertase Pin-like site-specific DNA recombinase
VSGVGTLLRDRPQGKRLYDMLRAGDTLVVRWLDRLGRNYQDVTEVLREFLGRGVIVRTIISSLTFDGAIKDPMQRAVRDALIGFMAAMAEAEAEARKEAQRAGIAHARSRITAYRGRKPSYTPEQLEKVRDLLAQGTSVSAIGAATGLSRQTIYRIKEDPEAAIEALAVWA